MGSNRRAGVTFPVMAATRPLAIRGTSGAALKRWASAFATRPVPSRIGPLKPDLDAFAQESEDRLAVVGQPAGNGKPCGHDVLPRACGARVEANTSLLPRLNICTVSLGLEQASHQRPHLAAGASGVAWRADRHTG